jgi:DNA repair protein SbcD/Mre11
VAKVLFLADSHLGLDTPVFARTTRRRRGDDFLANHRKALSPALNGDVDMVIHGGDVFDRSRVHSSLAYQAYEPLLRVAERGIPVFMVPGNHERSRLPHIRFLRFPRIHIFESPCTYVVNIRGLRIALSGFPYERENVRAKLPALREQTGWRNESADVRLMCIHHCVEGATVGPSDFMFRAARDVVRHRDVPSEFNALLSGHIHRHQVLTKDLRGAVLQTPVLYPGSLERTAFAEIGERKGYMILELDRDRFDWTFHELYARPMVLKKLEGSDLSPDRLATAVEATIKSAPGDAVLTIHITGTVNRDARARINAAALRDMAPATMNVEIRLEEFRAAVRARRSRDVPIVQGQARIQLGMGI